MKQIEEPRVEVMHVAGAMVTKKIVELIQRFGQVSIATPINDIEPLVGVCVKETKPVFGTDVC